jgi:Xaa-Pro aminopeptidase
MITKLQENYSKEGLDGYIIPSHNQWFYHSNLLKDISSFSGSFGLLIVTNENLIFFTDSRYLLQAKDELPEGTLILDSHEPSSCEVLEGLEGKKLGIDPKLFTEKEIHYYEKFGIIIVEKKLFAEEKREKSQITQLPIEITGLSREEKLQLILEELPSELDYFLIEDPASLAWLLNIRARDLPHSPLLLGYAILDCTNHKIKLFTTSSQILDGIEILPLNALEEHLNPEKIYGLTRVTRYFAKKLPKILEIKDPTLPLRAKKNPTEIKGMKEAQKRDTLAFKKFTTWLEEMKKTGQIFDELTVVEKIDQARQEDPYFISQSFAAIAGYGSNGAIVHYHPTRKSNKICQGEIPILLLDSGGQYDLGGTTDITRVFALGEIPERVKEIYTDLLRGHLALASAVFPRGTSGGQLEVLARYHLWKKGLDYGHGTGHGVGHFSSVHEGPQAISKKNQVALEPGMIVSIEPGYYEEGAFGLRIENLYLVIENNNHFLEFELLTRVPLDTSLINFEKLDDEEKKQLEKFFPAFP